MFNKIFELGWLGKNTKRIKELEKKIEELLEENNKPYKRVMYANGIVTVICKDGITLSEVYDKANLDLILNANSIGEIKRLIYPAIKEGLTTDEGIIGKIDKEEAIAERVFESNSEEVLEVLDDKRFEVRDNKHYYKDTKIPLTGLILNSMLSAKNSKNDTVFEALVKFWLWSLLNPIEASRNDLFSFVKRNDIKLTTNGLLVCYRNIKNVKKEQKRKDSLDKELIEYISQRYFAIKAQKRSPAHYSVFKDFSLKEDNLKCVKSSTSVENNYKFVGVLKDLYEGLKDVDEEVTYTDGYTGKKVIRIGDIYREDEDKIDLNNRIECSNGLHVGARSFGIESFGNTSVIVLVNPKYVRAVPRYDSKKMRVSEMFVACKTSRNKEGGFDDDVVDIIPFEEEYFNTTLKDIEKNIKLNNPMNVGKNSVIVTIPEIEKVVIDLKTVLKDRVVLSGYKKEVVNA